MRLAMTHGVPDRVPVMCQLALGHYFLHSDRKPSDIWFDSEVFAGVLAECRARYEFDGLLVNLPGRPPNWREHLLRVDQDERGEVLRWRSGHVTRIPPD